MEAWERGWVAMPERLAELTRLRAAFLAGNKKPSRQWIIECMTTISVLLFDGDLPPDKTDLLSTLTLAMWQSGYEAALEFVLPEGAGE